ncbi:hypothetical protein PTTG_26034 [Puccinia triticina 1-1 BBBD Race 1]|uniref:OTU domain-containing protein n=1 Tax=Puccinia triticina (isolate 1-1 / race 1 (BBBD)) TaxID=630390 RepID=A0A180GX24_PUCT1|nr:hypothetical protein PTTG_26034 [Puccinia triticina 1-1 BBBD Race 1]
MSQIPNYLQQFILGVFDPPGNGNCGFHCIAQALGYIDNGWLRVQKEMVKEATKNRGVYSKLQGGEGQLKSVIESLTVENEEANIGCDQWLSKLAHGQIIANTYGRPVVFLSIKDCSTYLPLCVGPGDSVPIYLLYVDDSHWVLANVGGKDGVKPIPPPVLATRVTSKIAKEWISHIEKGVF